MSQFYLQLLARTGRPQATRTGHDRFTTPEAVAAYLENPWLRGDETLRRYTVIDHGMRLNALQSLRCQPPSRAERGATLFKHTAIRGTVG